MCLRVSPFAKCAHMKKQTLPMAMAAVALVWVLGAMPFSAFAQRERSPQGSRPAPHRAAGGVSHQGAGLTHGPRHSQNFRGRVNHGQLAWKRGRWHHATRKGRFGWWWAVGGVWYFYPEPFEGPPDYVSDIEVVDETTPAPPPPKEPHYALYYRPGDLLGTRYQTLEECSQARQQAGNLGICVWK